MIKEVNQGKKVYVEWDADEYGGKLVVPNNYPIEFKLCFLRCS